MPTVIGHAAVGAAAARAACRPGAPGREIARWSAVWAAVSCLPDADVAAFALGIPYEHPFGHRGASHSIGAAVLFGLLFAALCRGPRGDRRHAGAVAALVYASHPLLDLFTDGGLGIAILWPFTNARFFAPWRPIPVAPIGAHILSRYGLYVLAFEALLSLPLFVWAWRRRRGGVSTPGGGTRAGSPGPRGTS